MANRFKKVAFTCYAVSDMERSRAFYEGVLGLSPGDNFGGKWQEYDLGGTTFAITTNTTAVAKAGTQGSVAFEVDDLIKLMTELKAKGVKFGSPTPRSGPYCLMVSLRDPDGNEIDLHQLKG